MFENGDIDGILLGDNGYALKQYLLTQLLCPNTRQERNYNYAHCQTRVRIENLFGVWKRRFPCLSRQLRLKLDTSLAVISACGVLHNICTEQHVALPEPAAVVQENFNDVAVPNVDYQNYGGQAQRQRIINLF